MSALACRAAAAAGVVGIHNARHHGVAYHVDAGKAVDGDAIDTLEHALGINESAHRTLGQVNLADVAGDYSLGAKANAGEKHLHLLGRCVLCFVQNDERIVQCPPTHEGQRCNFQRIALEGFLHFFVAHQIVERVVQGAQVGVHLLGQVAGKKAQAFTSLYGRAGQHNALHGAALQRINRAGHSQIGFACARGANAKGNVVRSNILQIQRLIGRARAQVCTAGGELDGIGVDLDHLGITGQHQLQRFFFEWAVCLLIQGLQQIHGLLGLGFGAVHLELFMAVCNLDLQTRFDGAQVRIGRATKVAQTKVVVRCKGVAQDHADNSLKEDCRCWRQRIAMIGKLTGTLLEKNPPQVLVDCHGVGYEVQVPMSTFYNLPGLGDKISLLTHFIVREDAQLLYGFATPQERQTFRELIKVSGVGPRMALSLLSGMGIDDLVQAIALQEVARLVKVPGIGKKTAERLLLELKGKLGDAVVGTAGAQVKSDAQSDILQALLALGYSDKEAAISLKALPADVGVSDGIKLALKALAK